MILAITMVLAAISAFYWIKWMRKDRKSKWYAFWRFINMTALGIMSILIFCSLLATVLWTISIVLCAIITYYAFRDDKKAKDVR